MEKYEQPADPKIKAMAELELIKQQLASMGGNDFEIPAIEAMIEEVKAGTLDADEARKKGNAILESKSSNYH